MSHLLRIAALTACLALSMLLPFLPGRYDSLAVPLSMGLFTLEVALGSQAGV